MDSTAFKREFLSMSQDMRRILHETTLPLCQQRGLTLQQMQVLVELTWNPGLTAGELSDRAGILRTNFSSVCRKLEDRGLVERQRREDDKRAFELRVSQEGRALMANIDADMQRRYGDVLANEPQETFDTIYAGFRALSHLAKKMER